MLNFQETVGDTLNLNVTMQNFQETVGDMLNLNVTMQIFQETVGDTLNLNGIGLEEREQQLIARK